MSRQRLLVLGGTGFIGRALVTALSGAGLPVRVATRRRVHARELLVLPTVEVVEADPYEPAILHALLDGCDGAINLVGVLHDRDGRGAGSASGVAGGASGRYGRGFAAAHVELPRRLVSACQERRVRRLLHVGALGASADAPSAYLRSKADGARLVLEAPTLNATVFAPSVVFGAGDRFLNLFATLAALAPFVPLGGAQARLQPVWVQDLVTAMTQALDEPATYGRSYEICGPRVYTLAELVRLAARAAGHPRPVIGLPAPLARLQALLLECLPGPTLLSRDNLLSLQVDNIASIQPYVAPAELGFQPAPLEPIAAQILAGGHARTRFSAWRAQSGR
jgi:NADH dehydrogenase